MANIKKTDYFGLKLFCACFTTICTLVLYTVYFGPIENSILNICMVRR